MKAALIVAMCAVPCLGAVVEPANPDANDAARRMLRYLAQLPGKYDRRVLSGQRLAPGTATTSAIAGIDYGQPDVAAANRAATEHWKAGGLVLVSFPAGPSPELPDRVAKGLAELRDAGLVALVRPVIELNSDPAAYVALWRKLFRNASEDHKLNNLLWVFSPPSTPRAPFFPGRQYCDLVGFDYSGADFVLTAYNELAAMGKPFGLTALAVEDSFDAAAMTRRLHNFYPLVSFFLSSRPVAIKDSWIVDRDGVDWRAPGHLRWKQRGALAIGKVEVLTASPAAWKRTELGVDLRAAFDTPFDSAQIAVDALVTTPSGRAMTAPAFFYQPFERQVWGRPGRMSEEVMVESGPAGWRVRLTPTEAGRYTVRIRATDRTGSVTSDPVSFTAAAGNSHGFVRVSKKDPHYFEFDDGTPFFANGLNIVEHPLSEYYRYLTRLSANGGNFSRLWLGFEYFGLELGSMGDYRLDNAWQLDQVMDLSEHLGVYQKMTVDYMRFINPRPQPAGARGNVFARADWAYGVENGGPCNNMLEFFTLPEARRLFKNRLRYLVARWGYSQAVMAWELWNEINLVDPAAAKSDIILPWNQEMCRYLKSVDPWQHLTTNSLSGRDLWAGMWTMPENDFAQRHGYWSPLAGFENRNTDMAENVLTWLDSVSGFQKPFLMAEFGLQRDRLDLRAICDRDQEGDNLHDGIWAAIAGGSAGTAQLWWWGQYVDPKNLYFHYQAVANFARGVPWTTAGFRKAEAAADRPELRAVGLQGNGFSFLWLHNKAHTWWNVVENLPIPVIEGAAVTLSNLPNGRQRIEYWDTWKGSVIATTSGEVRNGSLRLAPPPIQSDIAVKIVAAR